MTKRCSLQKDENTEAVTKDFNNKVTLINTSWKMKCESEKGAQEKKLNAQCIDKTKTWADELTKKHKSREELLELRVEQLIKDVQREEGKLLNTM